MAYFRLLSLVFLALTSSQVSAIPSYGGFVPAFPNYQQGGYEQKPFTLTCAVNFTNFYKKDEGIVNSIAVTIKEKSASYGGMKPSLFSYVGNGGGLTATFEIFSAYGGPVAIAFTERARPEKGCYTDDFGPFLTPKSSLSGPSFGSYGTTGSYGGYGNVGAYGSYGAGNYGGAYGIGNYGGYGGYGKIGGFGALGGGLYGGGYGNGYGGGYGDGYGSSGDVYVPGVVTKVNLSPGTASSINIDNLDGFSDLKELAGRGVIVCPQKSLGKGYKGGECEGGILSCCALHYDDGDLGLAGKYGGNYY